MIGRYYAMDRDRRWQRVKSAYDLLTQGRAEFMAENALAGLEAAYARGETDEFVNATAILPADGKPVKMEDGDSVIFLNFRSDRARQLSRPFIESDFGEFEREVTPRLATYCTLTGYSDDFQVSVAFPPERIKNGLGEYVANLGLRQLRIAETEKYPHVTFFFNGGEEISFPGEDRVLVPSPDVATYDLKPEMSAAEVTDKLVAAIGSKQYDVIVCNYANPDMVGHTGDLQAAIKAIETVDDLPGPGGGGPAGARRRSAGDRRPRQRRADARRRNRPGAYRAYPEPGAADLRWTPPRHAGGDRCPRRHQSNPAENDGAGATLRNDRRSPGAV